MFMCRAVRSTIWPIFCGNTGTLFRSWTWWPKRRGAWCETAWETLCLGPLGVLPEYQRYGVGRILVERVTTLASEMGFGSIFLYGDPSYYRRLGFLPGEQFGIRNGEGQWAAALQGRELRPGALEKVEGRFLESEAFRTDPEAAARFDRTFPEREKKWLPSQDLFLELVNMVRQ